MVRHTIGWTLAVTMALAAGAFAETGKTIEVTTGKTIARSWDDVKAANYAYGPKQEYDAATKQTHIYLPYGADGLYFQMQGVNLTAPGSDGTGTPLVLTTDGSTSGTLVYRLHFDKAITSLQFYAGWSEWGVGDGTVGGAEFSTDGRKWTTIAEIDKGGIIEPLADGKKVFDGLKAQDLYVRLYSRDKNNPEAAFGPNRWMKIRMAGDPGWGDASTTFFRAQMQLWVTTAD